MRDRESTAVKTCIVLGSALILLGVIALCGAYFFADDPVWRHQSRLGSPQGIDYGFYIELARLVLFVIMVMWALGRGFAKPLGELLDFMNGETWQLRSKVLWFRLFLLLLAIALGHRYVGKCFHASEDGWPARLVAQGEQNNLYDGETVELAGLDQRLDSARRAFMWYAVYSSVFYCVLLPLVIITPTYAFVSEDWQQLLTVRRDVQHVVEHQLSIAEAKSCFDRFHKELTERSTRDVRLLVAIGVGVAFEQYIGALVMSVEARVDVLSALLVAAAGVLLLAASLYVYYDGWQEINRYLREQGESAGLEQEHYTPQAFVKLLLKHDYSVYILGTLLATPWKDQLMSVFQVFGGR